MGFPSRVSCAHFSPFPAPFFRLQRRPFNDKARLEVKGGDGGNGCSSFARTRDGMGPPNGGNGGPGGNVYLRTSPHMTTFNFSTFHFSAGNGRNGGSELLNGAAGDDTIIDIPPGTVRGVCTDLLCCISSFQLEFPSPPPQSHPLNPLALLCSLHSLPLQRVLLLISHM